MQYFKRIQQIDKQIDQQLQMASIRPFADGRNSKTPKSGIKSGRRFDTSFTSFNNYIQKSQEKRTNFLSKTFRDAPIHMQKLDFSKSAASGTFLPPKSIGSKDKYCLSNTNRNFSSTMSAQIFNICSQTPSNPPFPQNIQQSDCRGANYLKTKIQSTAMERFKQLFKRETNRMTKPIQEQQSKKIVGLLETTSRKNRQKMANNVQNTPKQRYFRKSAKIQTTMQSIHSDDVKANIKQVLLEKQSHLQKQILTPKQFVSPKQVFLQGKNILGSDTGQSKNVNQAPPHSKQMSTDFNSIKERINLKNNHISQKHQKPQQLSESQVIYGQINMQSQRAKSAFKDSISSGQKRQEFIDSEDEQNEQNQNKPINNGRFDSQQQLQNEKKPHGQITSINKKNSFEPSADMKALPTIQTTERTKPNNKNETTQKTQSKQAINQSKNINSKSQSIDESIMHSSLKCHQKHILAHQKNGFGHQKGSITIKTPKQLKSLTSKQKYSQKMIQKQEDQEMEQVNFGNINSNGNNLEKNIISQVQTSLAKVNKNSKSNTDNKGNQDSKWNVDSKGGASIKSQVEPNAADQTKAAGKNGTKFVQSSRPIKSLAQVVEHQNLKANNNQTQAHLQSGMNSKAQQIKSLQNNTKMNQQPAQQRQQFSSDQNDTVQQLFYLIGLIEALGGYHNNSKHFYANSDSSMIQILMNHRLAAYYISQQFYYYQNVFLQFSHRKRIVNFYSLQPHEFQEALQDEQVIESFQELKKSFEMTPKLIKHTFEKCKVYLKKDQKTLKLQATQNYHSQCAKYLKNQFTDLNKIYEKNKTETLSERLCFIIQVFCVLMSLHGQELKQFQDLEDIGPQNYHTHIKNYKHFLLR